MVNLRKPAFRGALAASVVAGLLAGPASAGSIPADGVWFYDNTATVKSTDGHAIFKGYLKVVARKPVLYGLSGIVLGGKCKKKGRTLAQPIGYSTINQGPVIAVAPDGSFSATRKGIGDATGVKGTVTVKGVFSGNRASGKVTAHLHNPVFGDCRGTGRFSRAKGEKIG